MPIGVVGVYNKTNPRHEQTICYIVEAKNLRTCPKITTEKIVGPSRRGKQWTSEYAIVNHMF